MKIQYCLPIIKTTKIDVLKIIEENKTNYRYFEIWLDYIEELDNTFIKKLIDDLPNRLILLFRRKNLETMHMNYAKRIGILTLFEKEKVFFDLDIVINKKELIYLAIEKNSIAKIISYHNYKNTPNDTVLKSIIIKMQNYSPEIIKISTYCNSEKDALRLLQLQQALKEQKHIILGMGEHGTITRIFATLWGNEMIFAPRATKENSAPGQLTKTQLEKIINILNN
jgi:3-dehydroquinate dehydratase-1